MAATQAAVSDLRMDAEDTLQWYIPDDEPRVSYGFCNRCGASVFWRVNGAAQISICAGTLDQPTGLTTAGELFAGEVSDYATPAAGFHSFKGDRLG